MSIFDIVSEKKTYKERFVDVLRGRGESDIIKDEKYIISVGRELFPQSLEHNGFYAVIDAVTALVCRGVDFEQAEVSTNGVIGADRAVNGLMLNVFNGKERCVSARCKAETEREISKAFKGVNDLVFMLSPKYDENEFPIYESLKQLYDFLYMMMCDDVVKLVRAIAPVGNGGAVRTICEMAKDGDFGFEFNGCCDKRNIFKPKIGSVVIEVKGLGGTGFFNKDIDVVKLGHTMEEKQILICNEKIELNEL